MDDSLSRQFKTAPCITQNENFLSQRFISDPAE